MFSVTFCFLICVLVASLSSVSETLWRCTHINSELEYTYFNEYFLKITSKLHKQNYSGSACINFNQFHKCIVIYVKSPIFLKKKMVYFFFMKLSSTFFKTAFMVSAFEVVDMFNCTSARDRNLLPVDTEVKETPRRSW